MAEDVTLDSLVGEHVFEGADFGVLPKAGYYDEDAALFRFRLDGVTYVAQEDPSDGYRSALGTLVIDNEVDVPRVPPVRVLCRKAEDGRCEANDILEMIAVVNGEMIAQVGTANTDDYYPSFVAEYDPTKMPVNAGVAPGEPAARRGLRLAEK